MDASGWKSEYYEMTTGHKFSAVYFPSIGFRWMFEVSSGLIVAGEESESFEGVGFWTWAQFDQNGMARSGRFTCDFECSAMRVVTDSPTELPSPMPTASPVTSGPTTTPSKSPSAEPTELPTADPSASLPTQSPSLVPTSAPISTLSPSALPTVAPTEICAMFVLTCEFGEFDGTYSKMTGFKTQYVGDNGFTFETGFIFNEIRWVFQSQTGSSILVSESFENGFDRIKSWSMVDMNFASTPNLCSIDCSASNSPTMTPTKLPTTQVPTQPPATAAPSASPSIEPSISPSNAPVTTEPSNLPTMAPSASTPTQSPSLAPTSPCLVFSMECSSSVFDGLYSYNAWQRSWIESSSGDEFSVTIFPSGLQWVFESNSNPELLISDSYQQDFSAIKQWKIQNRFDLSQVGEPVTCEFVCSALHNPSQAPSTSTTLQPSPEPSTSQPTRQKKYVFSLENHITGRSSLNGAEIQGWTNAMTNVMNGPDQINIISVTSMVPDFGSRRSLGNPDLNVTAEVVFFDEASRDAQMDQLLDESQQANMNTVLGIMFMMNGLPGAQSEFVGLLGSFDGAYYVPTMMPTEMPSVYKAKATEVPTRMPTQSAGTEITIVVDECSASCEDDIEDITDTVTGQDTTVISIDENPDGTVTVIVSCATCDLTNNNQIEDEVSAELNNNDEISVISVRSGDAGAKNGGGDSAVVQVASSGTTWMSVALIVAAALVTYVAYIHRQNVKNCVLCKQKDEVIEVPEGFDFEIARPNNVIPHGMVRANSMSSAWTAYTAQTMVTNVQEGDETHIDDEFEGNDTIDVVPANVVADGWAETGDDEYFDAESPADGFPETGHDEYDNEALYSRPCLDIKTTNPYGGESPYSPESPSAVAYETDIDSPTAVSYAPSGKRGFPTHSSASTPTQMTTYEFGSQDLSGFATLSPSAASSNHRGFFSNKRHVLPKDPSLQTEQLERDWVVAQTARMKNEKRMLSHFGSSTTLDDVSCDDQTNL